MYDLLDNRKELTLREDQRGCVNVVGLREAATAMPSDVLGLVNSGLACRRTGSTQVGTALLSAFVLLRLSATWVFKFQISCEF